MMILIDISCWIVLAYMLSIPVIDGAGERFALSVGLALGMKSLLLFVLIACGLQPGVTIQLTFAAAAFFAAGWIYRRKLPETGENKLEEQSPVRLNIITAIILGFLLILSLANALFFPITGTDALWYEIRGVRLFYETRFDLDIFNQDYSPLVPLLFAYQTAFGFEYLKIVFPVFYFCMVVVVYYRIRAGSGKTLAAMLTLVLGTTPYLWWHSVLPFLNLAAGFYFSLGAIYWFSLLNGILRGGEDRLFPEGTRLAGLSGILFGLAAWTRLEFLLYGGVAMAGLGIALLRTEGIKPGVRARIFRTFSAAMLGLPTAWFLCVFYFQVGGDSKIRAMELVCGLLWLVFLIAPLLISKIRFGRREMLSCIAVSAVLFFAALVAGGPHTVSISKAVFLGAYRTLFFNIYFSFTVFLILLLFLEPLKNGSSATRFLCGFLLAYLCLHFALYTYMPAKWDTLSAYIDATFIHPGKAANSSGTREMIALYPVLVFLVSCLPRVKAGFENGGSGQMKYFLRAIAGLNLLVLTAVFLVPRTQVMAAQWHMSMDEKLETRGAPDMPNTLSESFIMAHEIKTHTEPESSVYFPPLRNGEHRSPAMKVLYPRKIFWAEPVDNESLTIQGDAPSYIVIGPEWNADACEGKTTLTLGAWDYRMCRLKMNYPVAELRGILTQPR